MTQLGNPYTKQEIVAALAAEFTAVHNITLPDTIVNVIEPPSYEVLEGLIQLIEQKYQQGG